MTGWSGTPAQLQQLARFQVREVDVESAPAYKLLAAAIFVLALGLMATGVLG